MQAEDGAERHQAPAQLGPAAACLSVRTFCGPPTRAAPPQRHGRRRMAAARPSGTTQERWRAPDTTLWRQLPREPYPSAPPTRARVPPRQHAQLPAEPAHGSQLAPPPPLAPPAARHRHPSHSTGEAGQKHKIKMDLRSKMIPSGQSSDRPSPSLSDNPSHSTPSQRRR